MVPFAVDSINWMAVGAGAIALWLILTLGRLSFPSPQMAATGRTADRRTTVNRRFTATRHLINFAVSVLAVIATAEIHRSRAIDSVGGAALVGAAVAVAPLAMFLWTARRVDSYVGAAKRMSLVLLGLVLASILIYAVQSS
jgi:hypothetical protein